MTNPSASSVLGKFIWYDQMSNDLPGAEKFYSKVVGWTIAPNTMNAQRYSLLQAGEAMVGGLMPIPEEAAKMGVAPRLDGLYRGRRRQGLRRQGQGRRRRDPSSPDRDSQCRHIRHRRRSERRGLSLVQGEQRSGAGAGPDEARPHRLARARTAATRKAHSPSTPACSAGPRARRSTWDPSGPIRSSPPRVNRLAA